MSPATVREEATTVLGDVVARFPEATPELLLAELTGMVETIFALDAISCSPRGEWARTVWRGEAHRLVRQRRRELGLPVCTRHDGCPNAAALKPLVSVLVYQCENCSNTAPPARAELSEEYFYGEVSS